MRDFDDNDDDEFDYADMESVTDSESSVFKSVSPVGNAVPSDSEDSICVYTNFKLIEVLGVVKQPVVYNALTD
ncbi:hypothetical protein IW143_003227 [Coemansia sp. RSA 520]|nr:hypothetical protein IW143_003227 [Coemansia sp. RSA 520]